MLTAITSFPKSSWDETPAELEIVDEFTAVLDAKMQRRNALMEGYTQAWAELLDAAGWCVALRVDVDGCWSSARARRFLAAEPPVSPTWNGLTLVLAKMGLTTLELSERVAIWNGNRDEIPQLAATLTRREMEVLGWLREGKTCPEIAMILGLSHRTVEKHISNIYRKTGVSTRAAAILNRAY